MASDPGFGSGDNYLTRNEAADRTFVVDREAGMALRGAGFYGPSRFDMRRVGSANAGDCNLDGSGQDRANVMIGVTKRWSGGESSPALSSGNRRAVPG